MKNTVFAVLGLFAFFVGCDIVEDPYPAREIIGDCDQAFNDTVYNDTNYIGRRIMLEEFTGHKCPNCPAGQEIAEDIHDQYPDDFFSVAVHNSGSFSSPDSKYPADYETETGEKLKINYAVNAFPSGLINRSEINGQNVVDYRVWEAEVSSLLQDPIYSAPRFKVVLENIYNPDCRVLRVRGNISASQSLSGEYYITGYVLESGIISKQTDNRVAEPIEDYEHNHMLRVGFPDNGTGKFIFSNPNEGESFDMTLSREEEIATTLDESWVEDNLKVVVFIYELNTGEVVFAEEMKLKN